MPSIQCLSEYINKLDFNLPREDTNSSIYTNALFQYYHYVVLAVFVLDLSLKSCPKVFKADGAPIIPGICSRIS